jgi:hypothetical protein
MDHKPSHRDLALASVGATLMRWGMALVWAVVVIAMTRDSIVDPYDATLVGTARYAHNSEGALVSGMAWSAIELLVLYAIVRPWSFRRSWLRLVAALVIFVPLCVIGLLMTMHAGGIFAIHAAWLLLIVAVLIVHLLVMFFAKVLNLGDISLPSAS